MMEYINPNILDEGNQMELIKDNEDPIVKIGLNMNYIEQGNCIDGEMELSRVRRFNIKMTDYEHIVISAERYALGRMTYIVETTVNYILKEIEENKLSDRCLDVIAEDIRSTKNLGMDCDKEQWLKLLDRIEEVIQMTEKISFEVNEENVKEIENAIHNKIKAIHKRFENGTETEEDLLYQYPHFKMKVRFIDQTETELDVVENKYYEKMRSLVVSKDTEINKFKNRLQNISDEFLKYDWKNSTNEQIYNQLKSLYKSIFKKEDK